MIKKYIGTGLVALGLIISVSFAAPAQAAALTSAQVSAIISLLQSFGADASTVANVQTTLGGSSTSGLSCASFGDLAYGNFDTNPGGRVSQLQTWLGISSSSFGFGTYGPKTRALWNSKCGTAANSTSACRVDYPEGANIRSSTQSNVQECKSYCDLHGSSDAESNGGETVCRFQGTQIEKYSAKTCRIDYPEGANIRSSYQPTSKECKSFCDTYGKTDAASHGGETVCKFKDSQISDYSDHSNI